MAIYYNMLHHAYEVEQNQCIINILVGVLYLDFLLFVRLLVYRVLENIDGYTFSREGNIIYKYIFNVLWKCKPISQF